jgi:type III pantothenate kinase
MKALLIDAGNSRLKWALLRGKQIARVQARAWPAGDPAPLLERVLRGAGAIDSIYVCNVAGAAVTRALSAAARTRHLPSPRIIRSARRRGQLRNGYDEPWRLGADRWVALLGAQARFPQQALCLVSIGTALTVDFLDARGRHRGGLIIPGPELMSTSLEARTAGIRRRAQGGGVAGARGLFTRNTRQALRQGARHACAALIERAFTGMSAQLGGKPRLLLSGGALEQVAPLLRLSFQRYAEPVLSGLAVIARQPGLE